MSSQLDYEINKELGECYLFMGDLEKAEDYYNKAAGSNGTHPEPYIGLATVAVHRGELEKAMGLYQKAHDIHPGDKALAGMALIQTEKGDYQGALSHYLAALDQNPENMVALYGIVQTGHVTGRLAEVVPYLENYLAIDPIKHEIRYSLAGCLACIGEKDQAREHLEKILEQDSSHEPALELIEQLS